MRTIEYTLPDAVRSEWNAELCGSEPDKVQWQDDETSLPCLAVRGQLGAWCGYVGVSEDHPAFGRDYDDVEVDVHGGLTFAALCQPGDQARSVCHVVDPGENDRVWWFGFDCAHANDLAPYNFFPRAYTLALSDLDRIYRDLNYVRSEVRRLARQLNEMG